eukprot:scaffold1732_cov34-Tisochrysis_lutea.AAC.3
MAGGGSEKGSGRGCEILVQGRARGENIKKFFFPVPIFLSTFLLSVLTSMSMSMSISARFGGGVQLRVGGLPCSADERPDASESAKQPEVEEGAEREYEGER